MPTGSSARSFRAVARSHVLLGVPLAALLHSILQFAYEGSWRGRDFVLFPIHFLAGVVVGSLILVPAFFAQAVVFHVLTRARIPAWAVLVVCGGAQAGIVALWARYVG